MVRTFLLGDLLNKIVPTSELSLPNYKPLGLEIIFQDINDSAPNYQYEYPPLPFAASDLFYPKILEWRLLAGQQNDKVVYEVTFDINGSGFEFRPGDTIGIIPRNSKKDVDEIINRLCLSREADCNYILNTDKSQKGMKIPNFIPKRCTIRYLLTHCIDLRGVVKKLFILALSKFTSEENERKILELLCSKEGSSLYNEYILNMNTCLIDILNNFKSCNPPITVIMANLPRLLPRPYSIANSQLNNRNVLKICFSVITRDGRKGLTTGWLESLLTKSEDLESKFNSLQITEDKIPIYLRKNLGFIFPDVEKPVLMIGPGTGVAPFIGFLEERSFLVNKQKLGESWLFFGCRNPQIDYLYKKELTDFLNSELLNRLSVSFSRTDDGIKYVQDDIRVLSQQVGDFIRNGATILVCGDIKEMASQVKESIVECLINSECTKEEAELKVTEMEKEKRYLVDIWS